MRWSRSSAPSSDSSCSSSATRRSRDRCAELLPALPWLVPFASLSRLANTPTPTSPMRRSLEGRWSRSSSPHATSRRPSRPWCARCWPRPTVRSSCWSWTTARTDDTAAIVERLAAEDPRVRLVRGEPLPPGWYGKPWACLQGYRAARGELLLFTDADTRHEPELLARAVGALRAERAELRDGVAPRSGA